MWHAHNGMRWWMLFGTLWSILLIAAIFLLVVNLSSPTRPDESRPSPVEAPLDVAKRRYAAGEITREPFEQISHDLADSETASPSR